MQLWLFISVRIIQNICTYTYVNMSSHFAQFFQESFWFHAQPKRFVKNADLSNVMSFHRIMKSIVQGIAVFLVIYFHNFDVFDKKINNGNIHLTLLPRNTNAASHQELDLFSLKQSSYYLVTNHKFSLPNYKNNDV